MFFTWTGKGVVVLFIVLGALLPAALLFVLGYDYLFPDAAGNVVEDNPWILFSFYLLIVAALTFPLGRYVLKEPQRRIFIDPKTGGEHVIVTEHTALGMSMKTQTYLFAGAGIVCLLAALLKHGGLF